MRLYAKKRKNTWTFSEDHGEIVDRTFKIMDAKHVVRTLKNSVSGGYFRINELPYCETPFRFYITLSFKDAADEAAFIILSSDGIEI
jgi:hypothetical protein